MLKLFEKYPLFKECVEAIDKNVTILSFEESKKIYSLLEIIFPIGFSSIDWEKVPHKITFDANFPEQIISSIQNLLEEINFDKKIYILWDSTSIPILKTDLKSVINHINSIVCVSQKIWFLNVSLEYVVEWKFGSKMVGLATSDRIKIGNNWKNFLNSIDTDLSILSQDQSMLVFKLLKNKFGFKNMVVDWNIITNKMIVSTKNNIVSILQNFISNSFDKSIYLLWQDSNLPVLESSLDLILSSWDEMLILSKRIWIFSKASDYIIEVQNNGLLIGLPPINRNIQLPS